MCSFALLIQNDDLSTSDRVPDGARRTSLIPLRLPLLLPLRLLLLLFLQSETKHLDSLPDAPSPSPFPSPSPSPSRCPFPLQPQAHPPPPGPASTAPENPSSCSYTRRDGHPRWPIALDGREPRCRGSASWLPGLVVSWSDGPSRPLDLVWRECDALGVGGQWGWYWQRGLLAPVVAAAGGLVDAAHQIGCWGGRM